MFYFLTRLKHAVAPMFCRIPVDDIVSDQLYQARLDMLNAEYNAEHWTEHVSMLQERIFRLTTLKDKL